MVGVDGNIDYSKYGRPELGDALSTIDRGLWPKNYENLTRELAKRPPPQLAPRSPVTSSPSLSSNAANFVFSPPILAYGLVVVHGEWYGLGLYTVTLALAYRLGFLERFREWPAISQLTVFAGALLMGAGLYFRIYGMLNYRLLLPCSAYALLALVAGLSLRRLR